MTLAYILISFIKRIYHPFPRLAAGLACLLFCWTGKRIHIDSRKIPDCFKIAKINTSKGVIQTYTAAHEGEQYKGTIVFIHGWAGHPMQFKRLSMSVRKQGYQVVLFDAYGHGGSSGHFASLGDYTQALNDVVNAYPDTHTVIAHSFGGLTTLWALSQGLQLKRAVIIGAPESTRHLAEHFIHRCDFPAGIIEVMTAVMTRYNGFDYLQCESAQYGPQISASLLILHDEHDLAVPLSEARLIAAHCPSSKLIETQHLGHKKILSHEEVIATITSFIESEA